MKRTQKLVNFLLERILKRNVLYRKIDFCCVDLLKHSIAFILHQ